MTKFEDWTGGRYVPFVGTNTGAAALPFQSWRRFKEAFAPEIVERALTETPGKIRHISDPFGGSGTTALAAQFLGVKPTTIEVNPFLADLIEAKIAPVNLDELSDAYHRTIDSVTKHSNGSDPKFPGAPLTFVEPGVNGRFLFSKDVARRILAYRSAIDSVQDDTVKRILRVILASTTVPVSNVVVNGKGRRYRLRWRERQRTAEFLDQVFRSSFQEALNDLRRYAHRSCLDYTLIRGDARTQTRNIGKHDLAVFSPPYPNSLDYTDVYNVELWCLGYLSDRESNTRLRRSTLRSHVQLFYESNTNVLLTPTLAQTVENLRAVRTKLWNPHIPEMIASYATDLSTVMVQLAEVLRPKGRVYTVVGDSLYAGIYVPIAQIFTEFAQSIGYDVLVVEPSRSMRSSPQQGGKQELSETLIVLERH